MLEGEQDLKKWHAYSCTPRKLPDIGPSEHFQAQLSEILIK